MDEGDITCLRLYRWLINTRGQPRLVRQGKVLLHFQDFREKFWSKFWIFLYVLYIFTSPSAQNREKSASLGRRFLPNRPLGWTLNTSCTVNLPQMTTSCQESPQLNGGCSVLRGAGAGVWTKALSDICSPMKNGMRGHLPPKGIAGVDICPLQMFTKISLKILYFGQSSLYLYIFLLYKNTYFSHGSCFRPDNVLGDFRICWRKPWEMTLRISSFPPFDICGEGHVHPIICLGGKCPHVQILIYLSILRHPHCWVLCTCLPEVEESQDISRHSRDMPVNRWKHRDRKATAKPHTFGHFFCPYKYFVPGWTQTHTEEVRSSVVKYSATTDWAIPAPRGKCPGCVWGGRMADTHMCLQIVTFSLNNHCLCFLRKRWPGEIS